MQLHQNHLAQLGFLGQYLCENECEDLQITSLTVDVLGAGGSVELRYDDEAEKFVLPTWQFS